MANGKTNKSLGAAGGGLLSAVAGSIANKVIPGDNETVKMLTPLAGGVVGFLMMDGKNGTMDYVGAGAIGGAIALTAKDKVGEFLGDEVLADDLDDFFEEVMNDEDDDDQEYDD